MKVLLLISAMALMVIGCTQGAATATPKQTAQVSASATPAASVFFPRHASPLGTGDQALIEGQVVFADGCVWVQPSGRERLLVVWPSNTTLGKINDLPAVLGPDSELLVETGSVTRLAGRSTDLETARNLAGNIPEQCSTNGFWVASNVANRP